MMRRFQNTWRDESLIPASRSDEAQTSLNETRHAADQSLLTSAATIGCNLSEFSNLRSPRRQPSAFTLIEMLVVIAIIGLLAAMVVGGASHFREVSVRARVQTELNQVVSAIESYHKKFGFYPQDNANNPARPPLYYELTGDDSLSAADANSQFGVKGIVNTEKDENGRVLNFFSNIGIEGKNYKVVDAATKALALTAGYKGPDGDVNPWRYVSKNPTNNTETYDLWAEVLVGNKKIVIGNWKD